MRLHLTTVSNYKYHYKEGTLEIVREEGYMKTEKVGLDRTRPYWY